VRGLVDRAHDRALAILHHNRELLESISSEILEKEVIEGEALKNLLATSVMPQEAVAV
jgi:cell division protease FtsH